MLPFPRTRIVDLPRRRLLLAAACFLCHSVFAQSVVLHLHNGDRVAGIVVSETTNSLTLSNAWAGELKVPVAEIERREALSTETANLGAGTNTPGEDLKAPPQKPWTRQLTGEASFGVDWLQGAVDRELYYGKIGTAYAQSYQSDPKEFFRMRLDYRYDYGRTDGLLSANDILGSAKTDFDISRRAYVYNLGGAGYDEIRKIDLHYEEGPGAGRHLLAGSNFVLNAELGANYQVQERSDETTLRDVYYRLGQDATLKLNHQMQLTQKIEFFPRMLDPGEYRFRFESNLSYALVFNLFLSLSVIDFYDTQPAIGVPPNDLQFRSSLGAKF